MCRLTNLAVALCLDRVCGSQYLRRLNLRSLTAAAATAATATATTATTRAMISVTKITDPDAVFFASEEAHMKYKPKKRRRAASGDWRTARCNACRDGSRRRHIGKNSWRASQSNGVA